MIVDFIQAHWRLIVDLLLWVILGLVSVRVFSVVAVKVFLAIRTRFFWKPKVGDRVITHGLFRAKQVISNVYEDGYFRCTTKPYSSGSYSSSVWDKKSVTFIRRGEWQ